MIHYSCLEWDIVNDTVLYLYHFWESSLFRQFELGINILEDSFSSKCAAFGIVYHEREFVFDQSESTSMIH